MPTLTWVNNEDSRLTQIHTLKWKMRLLNWVLWCWCFLAVVTGRGRHPGLRDARRPYTILLLKIGIYVRGRAPSCRDFNCKGRLRRSPQSRSLQTGPRSTRWNFLHFLSAAGKCRIQYRDGRMSTNSQNSVYGPGADLKNLADTELDVDEPKAGLWKGAQQYLLRLYSTRKTVFIM